MTNIPLHPLGHGELNTADGTPLAKLVRQLDKLGAWSHVDCGCGGRWVYGKAGHPIAGAHDIDCPVIDLAPPPPPERLCTCRLDRVNESTRHGCDCPPVAA